MEHDLSAIDFHEMGQICFGHSARRTANLLTRHFNRHLAGFGLELTQAQLLAVIASGEAQSASDIARYLGIERSTLARNLKPLEAAGLIERKDTTGRSVVPVLTNKGRTLALDLHAAWQRAQQELTRQLGEDNAVAIRSHMSVLRRAVRDLEEAATKHSAPTFAGPASAGSGNPTTETTDKQGSSS